MPAESGGVIVRKGGSPQRRTSKPVATADGGSIIPGKWRRIWGRGKKFMSPARLMGRLWMKSSLWR